MDEAIGSISDAVISPLVEVEFSSLLSLKVRMESLHRDDANAVLAQFRIHLADGLYRMIDTGPREFELARGWLACFSTPLRTLDALHLATAFAHRLEIITTDKVLARAAGQVGAKCRLLQ